MPGSDGFIAVRTLLYDEGVDDRLTTVGSYMFGRAD
jgi:hypothetical protein